MSIKQFGGVFYHGFFDPEFGVEFGRKGNGITGQSAFPERDKQPRSGPYEIAEADGKPVGKRPPQGKRKRYLDITSGLFAAVNGFRFDI